MEKENQYANSAYQKTLYLEPQGDLNLPFQKVQLNPSAQPIKLSLLPHGRAKSASQAEEIAQNSRSNIGSFYSQMYRVLSGKQEASPDDIVEIIKVNGDLRSLRPDIASNTLSGREYIEVKASDIHGATKDCRKAQVENYSWSLLNQLSNGSVLPSVEYAFFRYGRSDESSKLHSLTSERAAIKLSKSTQDLLVIPFNLALLLFANSEIIQRKRENGDDQDYFRVSGKALSLLNEMNHFDLSGFIENYHQHVNSNLDWLVKRGRITIYKRASIEERLESALQFAKRKSLCLDDFVIKRKMSDEIQPLVYGSTEVTPFAVTTYALKDPERWVNSFARNHRSILSALNLRDLFYEQKKEQEAAKKREVPF